MIIDYGEFKLRETEESETFYIATLDTHIIVTKDKYDVHPYDAVGKIKVFHDGLYFGAVDEMYSWIKEEIISHLIKKDKLIKVGETAFGGETCWGLQA